MNLIVHCCIFLASVVVLNSCGASKQERSGEYQKDVSKTDPHVDAITPNARDTSMNRTGGGMQPTSIAINRSEVLAEVISKNVKDTLEFSMEARILEVTPTPAYPSFAVVQATYSLRPSYVLDEDKTLADHPRNKQLLAMKHLAVGARFKASIFLSQPMQWYIYEPIPD